MVGVVNSGVVGWFKGVLLSDDVMGWWGELWGNMVVLEWRILYTIRELVNTLNYFNFF
jgi:hypothetical protein